MVTMKLGISATPRRPSKKPGPLNKFEKPSPAPMLRYMELTGATPAETLFVGDTVFDAECAHGAGVDFALAVWGAQDKSVEAEYYPETPSRILDIVLGR